MLGICYHYGRGVRKNYKKAFDYYTQAANKDILEALYQLGFCYCLGKGVKADLKKAVGLWMKAADRGHKGAQECLVKLNEVVSHNQDKE